MKKILIYLLIIVSIFWVYRLANTKKIDYVSIGDSLIKGYNSYNIESYGYNNHVKNYLENHQKLDSYNNVFYNYSINGLRQDIIDNRTYAIDDNKQYFFKKILRESDLLVISIGMDELSNKIKYENNDMKTIFNNLYNDINNLIIEIKKYVFNDIIFIGYYNPSKVYNSDIDEGFCYLNSLLNTLMRNNDIYFIDIYELVKKGNYLDNPNNYHLNSRGYYEIANKIVEYIEKT